MSGRVLPGSCVVESKTFVGREWWIVSGWGPIVFDLDFPEEREDTPTLGTQDKVSRV